jgi:hypothetical protein
MGTDSQCPSQLWESGCFYEWHRFLGTGNTNTKEKAGLSASTSTDHIEQFFHHLAALKQYAQRILVKGDTLTENEEADKSHRMTEFLQIGNSFDLSEKEMVTILYREVFSAS